MAGVFINYRRDDARSEAGRLFDWLSQYFGKDQVFMDVSGSIEPGLEFDRVIENAVSSCEVLIVVIGKEWLTAVDENGKRRLENPNDFVRLEIAAALKRNIRVIPVLVEGAAMPEEGDLPEDLKRLCKRQASELSDNRWEFDTKQLVNVLQRAGMGVGPGPAGVSHEPAKPPPQVTKKTSRKAIASLVVGVLLMISYSEVSADQDSKMGALVFALVALGLAVSAFYDTKQNPEVGGTKGKALSISGMVLAAILSLAFLGTLTTPNPPVSPVAGPQPSSTHLSVPAPPVATPSVPPAPSYIDIGGSWRGTDGMYIFQQSGSNINVQLFNWNQVLIGQGTGEIAQGVVTITYVLLDNTGGTARLQVSANGKQMAGNYRNLVTGETGPMNLVR